MCSRLRYSNVGKMPQAPVSLQMSILFYSTSFHLFIFQFFHNMFTYSDHNYFLSLSAGSASNTDCVFYGGQYC